MDYSIKIGGTAGGGIQTVGNTLARVFSRTGLHVFSHQDYESRVRGGHNFFQIRFSDRPVSASRERIDILVALDAASIHLHEGEIAEDGRILYDSATLKEKHEGTLFLDIPLVQLATEHGGSRVMANVVAVGAVLGMLGMQPDVLLEVIADTFKKKGEEVVGANVKTAKAGHEVAVKQCLRRSLSVTPHAGAKMLLDGTHAIACGAISAGCKFYSAYPMTPSTGVMLYLNAKAREYGILVEQAEDEIAAINMALGASFAGVRAMTGTSGGGLALMVEGLSLAAMTETPVVIALAQRPGPATGLPTRTEQGDLLFVVHAGHGEFPRVVFAPGSPEEAFYLTNKAFDLAEKYQIPVFVLFDQYLGDSLWTCEGLDLNRITHTDYRLRGEAFARLPEYKRHAFTETGVTPMAVPGDSRHVVVTDSDEHDAEGHIIEDAGTRIKMVRKRLLKKMALIEREIAPPTLYGDGKPQIVIVGWGSTYGVMREAVDVLSKSRSIALLHFAEVYPFPMTERFDYLSILRNAELAICVENNATGQFARLMRAEKGFEFNSRINRYDGRPFLLEGLLGEINGCIGRL